MKFSATLCAAVALLFLIFPQQLLAEPKRPNVILIMTDDMGSGDFAFNDNPVVAMPNILALQQESPTFRDFHVDPTCSPTRAALMTGQYSLRTGVWHTIMARQQLRSEAYTMAELFRDNGYMTGIFGKWHLGDSYPMRPEDQGFGRVVIVGGGGVGQTQDHWGNDNFGDTYYVDGKWQAFAGHPTDVWFDEAEKFVAASARSGTPFFAYIPTTAAHSPWRAPSEYLQRYLDLGLPSAMARYYAMVTHVDERLGLLRKRLEQLGVADNTIVIFTSDNGTSLNPRSAMEGAGELKLQDVRKSRPEWANWKYNAGLAGYKGTVTDGGHRVPMIFHWPAGGCGTKREITELSAHLDLMPTFIDLLGLKAPQEIAFDGTSLRAALEGKQMPNRTIIVTNQRIPVANIDQPAVVMTEGWRYLPDEGKLYAIEQDRGQATDVASANPKVVRQLRKVYQAWWKAMAPSIGPAARPIIDGAQKEMRLTAHDFVLDADDKSSIAWYPGFGDESYGSEDAAWIGKEADYAVRPLKVAARDGGRFAVEIYFHDKPAVKAVPFSNGHLTINGKHTTTQVPPGQDHVRFEVVMPAGDIDLKAWFSNSAEAAANQDEASPAFFVYLTPLAGKN